MAGKKLNIKPTGFLLEGLYLQDFYKFSLTVKGKWLKMRGMPHIRSPNQGAPKRGFAFGGMIEIFCVNAGHWSPSTKRCFVFGDNQDGQLGLGDFDKFGDKEVLPVLLPNYEGILPAGISAAAAGLAHSAIIVGVPLFFPLSPRNFRDRVIFAQIRDELSPIPPPPLVEAPRVSKSQGVEGPQLFFFWFLAVLRPGGGDSDMNY